MSNPRKFSQLFTGWFQRNLSDPQVISLLLTIILAVVIIELFGTILAPILVSVVIAYLLVGLVRGLERLRCPHGLAVWIAYLVFLALVVLVLLSLIPALWKQGSNFVLNFPSVVSHISAFLDELKTRYPKMLGALNVHMVTTNMQQHLADIGRAILSYSLTSISGIIEILLYFILVPVMTFLFLKDSKQISHWLTRFLPKDRTLLQKVWADVNKQISNYIRGRVIEIIIVSIVSSVAFYFLGLQYSLLLGALVGISVIVPYVGAVIATIPVVVLGLYQWGFTPHFWYMILVYVIIIVADAYGLQPWLFSEAMDLHPIVIIISVLIFGGIWGFWGVFFAIPLATVVRSVMDAMAQ